MPYPKFKEIFQDFMITLKQCTIGRFQPRFIPILKFNYPKMWFSTNRELWRNLEQTMSFERTFSAFPFLVFTMQRLKNLKVLQQQENIHKFRPPRNTHHPPSWGPT